MTSGIRTRSEQSVVEEVKVRPEATCPEPVPPDTLSRYSFLSPCGIVLVGLFLRLWGLGQKSIWLDEIWSITVARMPFHSVIWSIRNQDPNASLYYLLLHFWINLGQNEFAIRLLSAITGAGTIWVLYVLGER